MCKAYSNRVRPAVSSSFNSVQVDTLQQGSNRRYASHPLPARCTWSLRAAMLTLLVLFSFISRAEGQVASQFPSTALLGSASQTVTVTMHSAGSANSVEVLTQGISGLDYTVGTGVNTCSTGTYAIGNTCTISVTFTPAYPGSRNGAVVVLDGAGDPIGTQALFGVGVGPLSVLTAGEITTVVGNGELGPPNTNNMNPAAAFVKLPLGEALDGAGNLYFTDSGNHLIGKISGFGVNSAGTLTYIAGTGQSGYSPNGTPATSALLNTPAAILVDGAGNVFFTEIGNNTVREVVQATGLIQTIAGSGTQGYSGDGGAATSARLNSPQGITFDASHNLYIADTGNNVIRKVSAADGSISTIAGSMAGNAGFAGDGQSAANALFSQPIGIGFGPDGSLYIADSVNNRVRRIMMPSLSVSTVAGTGTAGYSGDTRAATGAEMNQPTSVVVDAGGNLYISDSDNNVVRRVNASTGNITTLAGNSAGNSGGDGVNADNGTPAVDKPYGLALDPTGNLFIADYLGLRVREVYGNTGRIVFKDIKVGNTSPATNQALDNDGNAPLQLTSINPISNSVIGTATTCSTTTPMAPGAQCIIAVEFKPLTLGSPVNGTIVVDSNAPNSPDTILLSGNSLPIEPSTTTLTSNPNPSAFGQPVVFTATVSTTVGDNVTPKGAVQFYDGGTSGTLLGTVTLPNGSGSSAVASLSVSTLTIGQHPITAVYSGQTGVTATSTSTPPLVQIVLQAPTLNLTSSQNPAVLGTPIVFTAQVVGSSPTPTGTVTFKDTNGTTLDTETLNGTAIANTIPISTLSVGSHTITATYSGDSTYAASSKTLTQVIQTIATTTAVSASANPSIAGGTVSFAVTVTAQSLTSPNIPIGGTVSLTDNGTPLRGSYPLVALGTGPATATATIPVSALSTGTQNIVAVYSGDSNYAGSSSAAYPQTVDRATSNVALIANPASTISGNPVVLTATVTSNGGTPGGTVNFSIDGKTPISSTLTNGIATITVTTLSVGNHTVIASYLGDTNDSPATSPGALITIAADTTTTTLTSSQNPLLTLSPVTITAKVANAGSVTPTGTVTFTQDSVALPTIPVSATGTATITLPSLSAGTHIFSATYSGDATDLASQAAPLSEVVQLRSTTDILTTSATSLTGGQQITLISVVRWTGPATPTGSVTFMNGSQALATAQVDGTGVATVTVLLYGTSASISSTYSGDAFYASSSSSLQQVTIGPAPNFDFTANPQSFSLVTTQHEDVSLTISSLKGFTDTLSLGCLGLPLAATCTFSTDQFLLSANGAQTVQLTLDTGNPLLAGAQAKNEAPALLGGAKSLVAACFLPGSLLLGLIGLRFRKRRSFAGLFMLALLLAGLSATLTGCGTIKMTSTPPGVYNFAITATGKTGVSQSIPVTITVTAK